MPFNPATQPLASEGLPARSVPSSSWAHVLGTSAPKGPSLPLPSSRSCLHPAASHASVPRKPQANPGRPSSKNLECFPTLSHRERSYPMGICVIHSWTVWAPDSSHLLPRYMSTAELHARRCFSRKSQSQCMRSNCKVSRDQRKVQEGDSGMIGDLVTGTWSQQADQKSPLIWVLVGVWNDPVQNDVHPVIYLKAVLRT